MTRTAVERIEAELTKAAHDQRTGEVLWRIRGDDGSLDVRCGRQDRPFFIASATKLFVTAILAQLRQEGRITWDSPIAAYLPPVLLAPLADARDATVRSVMAHTAGLPDYFEGKRPDGPSTFARALAADLNWDVHDVVTWSAQMTPPAAGRPLYSDTGYQLLGALIEHTTDMSFAEAVQRRVCEAIDLTDTWVFEASDHARYDEVATMLQGSRPLRIPRAMASVQADGGIVSTVDDAMCFLDAFFDGRLFPPALLDEILCDWHRIFTPLQYGTGVMKFHLSPLLTGLRRVPAFYGHSGASGTVLFRCPAWGLTVVGTVNQVQGRSRPYQLMVRTALAAGDRSTN